MTMLFMPFVIRADSVGGQIVDEAIDASDANTLRLEIHFVMKVNYLWYFPHSQKDNFLISVQPIAGLSEINTAIREHIRIPDSLSAVIKNLYYDGTEENGRFIVLETNHNVGIKINQGRDMRSIIIVFSANVPQPAGECEPDKNKVKPNGEKK